MFVRDPRSWSVFMLALVLLLGCELKLDDDEEDAAVEEGTGSSIGNPDLNVTRGDGGTDDDDATSSGQGDGDGDARGSGSGDGDGDGDGDGTAMGSDAGEFMPNDVEVADVDAPDSCDRSLLDEATQVGGNISSSSEWAGAIHVAGDVSVRQNGTTLTIAPGTTVFVDPDTLIEVGWNSHSSIIDASGTAEAPIRFCAADASEPWRGLRILSSVPSSSALAYVLIEGAGARGGTSLGLNTGILIDHVWVMGSAAGGVEASGFRSDSQALSVTGNAGSPLFFNSASAIDELPPGSTFNGNGEDIAHITFTNVSSSTRYQNIGIPYQFDVGLSARGDSTMFEVDPGVEFIVSPDQNLEIGWNSHTVEFHIEGTESEPIVFRGMDERRGSWQGLVIQSNVRTASTMRHVHIMHGGEGGSTALIVRGSVNVGDITLKDNANRALAVGEEGLGPRSGPFSISGTEGIPAALHPQALVSFPGGTFSGNESDYISVDGGNIRTAGTIPAVDVPYRVESSIDIYDADVTIEAGAVFEMQNDVRWEVGWNSNPAGLVAVGTEDEPIVFRGVVDQPGFWQGMAIRQNVGTDSKLEYVEFADGGGGSNDSGILWIYAPIDVSNCTFSNSSGFGLTADADFMDYNAGNTFMDNAAGPVGTF